MRGLWSASFFSFESQEMIQSRTGPDYSVEVRVGSTIEDRNFEEFFQDCLASKWIGTLTARCQLTFVPVPQSINGASRGMSSFFQARKS